MNLHGHHGWQGHWEDTDVQERINTAQIEDLLVDWHEIKSSEYARPGKFSWLFY